MFPKFRFGVGGKERKRFFSTLRHTFPAWRLNPVTPGGREIAQQRKGRRPRRLW